MNRYDKQFKATKVETKGFRRDIHDEVEGSICYPAYFKVGERGWFLVKTDDMFGYFHRFHTSKIKNVIYEDKRIIVETKNTIYYFEEVVYEQE